MKNRLKSASAAIVLCLALGGGARVSAAPLFDINFSGDQDGAIPSVYGATPAAGVLHIKPTTVSGSVTVAENYTAGGVTLSGNSAVLKSTQSSVSMNLIANNGDFDQSQDYAIRFQLLFNGAAGDLKKNSLRVSVYNETYSYLGYQSSLIFSNGNLQLFPGSGAATVISNKWQADTLMTVELQMLYSESMFKVFINQELAGEIAMNPATPPGVRGISFTNGEASSSFELAITNLQGHAIPEPSSAALVGAVLLMAGRKWYQRSEKDSR